MRHICDNSSGHEGCLGGQEEATALLISFDPSEPRLTTTRGYYGRRALI